MIQRVIFVTVELAPTTSGGAGTVVAHLAEMLSAEGVSVTAIVATSEAEVGIPGVDVVVVVPPDMDGTLDAFVERSRRLGLALADVVSAGPPPDLVEFHDFDVPGWWSLTHREEAGIAAVPVAVRLHGPVEAMTSAMGVAPPPMDGLARLELDCFAMADAVIVPSLGMASWAIDRYELATDRVMVGAVPVSDVDSVGWSPSETPEFAAFGRLHEVKGSHDLLAAAIPVLDAHPEAVLRFIGPDGWSASHDRPMSRVLTDAIPPRLSGRIRLEGAMPRQAALEAMSDVRAVVVSSRFESFCAAAHEARRAGIPVVVPSLPAFEGLGPGDGMAVYDGTERGLTALMAELAADSALATELASAGAPSVADPVAVYRSDLPPARHSREQAGLATRAVKTLEERTDRDATSSRRWAQRLLQILPRPIATIAVRLLPRRIKDRFRATASWPAEEQRRADKKRIDDLRRAIRSGAFGSDTDPQVSIVIPCFNQGRWVTGAVASVFEQSVGDWEIVLVDDGSTDPDTVAALDELRTWPRVELIRQDNRGLPAARNVGITAASAGYVVPLDGDDELAPGFLERMVAELDQEPGAAFADCWALLFGDIDTVWVPRPYNPYWQLQSNGIVGCVLLRREAWESVGGYDESMRSGHEDWDLWVRLEAAGWGHVRVPEPLFRYRKHGVSMSVHSEAGFEDARRGMAERNVTIYASDRIRELKREWYPLVTALVALDDEITGPVHDIQIVPVAEELASAVTAARGKYLVDLRGRADRLGVVGDLADRLESAPDVAWVEADDLVVWRRWCVIDPDADPAGGLDGSQGPPPGDLAAGAFPNPAWSVVSTEVGVTRQRPEVAGRMLEEFLR